MAAVSKPSLPYGTKKNKKMETSAARREEIQKRLQLLKDEREREQRAFDELAAAHPELSANELTDMAKERAKEDTPTSILVAGATVSIGDYVNIFDSPAVLNAAERGQLVSDPVKRVYLGERGHVVRVMESFQGKPAVELRFADGAEKLFFAECLEVGDQCPKKKAAAARKADDNIERATGSSPPAAGRGGGCRAAKDEPEKAVPPPAPAWGNISMPRRGTRRPSASSASTSMLIPPPPAFLPVEAGFDDRSGCAEVSAPSPAVAQPSPPPSPVVASVAKSETAAKPPPAKSPAKSSVKSSMKKVSPQLTKKKAAAAKKSAVEPQPQASQGRQAIGLVKEALSRPTSHQSSPIPEDLGVPSDDAFIAAQRDAAHTSPEMADLVKTPRDDFLAGTSTGRHVAPVTPLPEERSQVPRRCPPRYTAKFKLGDPASLIPRYGAAIRHCWVAGVTASGADATLFHALILPPGERPLGSLLALATKALSWDVAPGKPVRRLFTEDGHELLRPGAVVDGLRLVATPGCALVGSAPGSAAGSSAARSVSPITEEAASRDKSPSPTLPAAAVSAPRPAPKAPRTATRPAKTPLLSTRVAGSKAPPTPDGTRPAVFQLRVYENGLYDADKYERVYRTVTVRSTYKTLNSVKLVMGRELEWRDGRKVEFLFDASGMELTELDQLHENASIVVSAGDRFIVPYPNSLLHKEALKLPQA